jgi:hypothetical protein
MARHFRLSLHFRVWFNDKYIPGLHNDRLSHVNPAAITDDHVDEPCLAGRFQVAVLFRHPAKIPDTCLGAAAQAPEGG